MTPGQTIASYLFKISGIGVVAGSIAEAAMHTDFTPLANIGAVGIVLGWLMWKVEPRMKAMEASLDRATRATMLVLIEIPSIAAAIKGQAQEIVDELDEAARKREGK